MTTGTSETDVKLTLEGGGLSFKRQVPESTALKILALAMGAPVEPVDSERRSPTVTSGVPPAPEADADNRNDASSFTPFDESVGEYLARYEAKRNVEKIAAIAAYFKEAGQSRFTSDEVKEQFPHAGEKVPGNFPRDFRWAIQSKWIAVDPKAPKQHYLTGTGSEAVKQKFSKDVKKASVIKTGKKRTSATKSEDS